MAGSKPQISAPKYIRVGETVEVSVRGSGNSSTFPPFISTLEKPDGTTDVLEQTSNTEDNTIILKSQLEGEHKISVSVNGEHIEGSPCDVIVYPAWTMTKTFSEFGKGIGELWDPWGVTVNKDGNYMVADSNNNRIEIFTPNGDHVMDIKFQELDKKFYPRQVAISSDNCYFIPDGSRWVDVGNNHVVICDKNGKFLGRFGQNQLLNPVGIAIDDAQGIVYVVDHCGYCVRLYNIHNGDYIKSFGSRGNNPGQFNDPRYITINNERQVLVTDCNNHRVQVFRTTGEFLFMFGCLGDENEQLNLPEGIVTDEDDNIYVCDCSNNRVMKYDKRGKFICCIASIKDELVQPTGIAITKDVPLKIVVVDYGNDCIRIFG